MGARPKMRTTSRASSARCGRQAARAAESAADHGGESRGHHRTAAARLAGGERESVLTESGTSTAWERGTGGATHSLTIGMAIGVTVQSAIPTLAHICMLALATRRPPHSSHGGTLLVCESVKSFM